METMYRNRPPLPAPEALSFPVTLTPIADPSDEHLLQNFTAGNRHALDELFRRCQLPAYREAYRVLRNDTDAQNAVQEGFINAWRHVGQFKGDSSFQTWLLRIVSNAAWLLLRKRRQQKTSIYSDEIVCACDPRTPLDQLIEEEEKVSAKKAITTIRRVIKSRATPEMRQVLNLRMRGFTFEEIAEKLGCCEKTARSVRNRLRKLVTEELAMLGYSLR